MALPTEAIYHGFFDDAAVFPPGDATLAKAVAMHLIRRADPITDPFVGPLILPADQVTAAIALAHGQDLDITALGSTAALDIIPTSDLVGVELRADGPIDSAIEAALGFAAGYPQLGVALELSAAQITDDRLIRLSDGQITLKFRTGGISADLYPTDRELLAVLAATVRTNTPFKLTAGLHRALRYTDPHTGLAHFGFLNIAAALVALRSGDPDRAAALICSNDGTTVTAVLRQDSSWRKLFTSFGTCNIAEPLVTLAELAEVREDTVAHF